MVCGHQREAQLSMGAPTPTAARPMGLTILAVLAAIGGVLGILAGVALVGLGGAAAASSGSAAFLGLGAVAGIIVLALGIANLAFAYGAWTLKPWAWPLGVALQILSLVWSGLAVLQGDIAGQVISIVIAAIILYYLFQPNIKALFGRA
jgi:hypothetical protein